MYHKYSDVYYNKQFDPVVDLLCITTYKLIVSYFTQRIHSKFVIQIYTLIEVSSSTTSSSFPLGTMPSSSALAKISQIRGDSTPKMYSQYLGSNK